jgi:very-short-patch-repair endonuclease
MTDSLPHGNDIPNTDPESVIEPEELSELDGASDAVDVLFAALQGGNEEDAPTSEALEPPERLASAAAPAADETNLVDPAVADPSSLVPTEAAWVPTGDLKLELDALTRVQYAMHANDVRAVREIRLENLGDEVLSDLRVSVTSEPAFAQPLELRLDDLRPGAVRHFEKPDFRLDHAYLDNLTERVKGSLRVEVSSGEQLLARHEQDATVYARNEWPGDGVFPELLAAFALPNEPAVAKLICGAGEYLARWHGSPSVDGYQRQNPEAVVQQAAAIYTALQAEEVQYVNPPASFESSGQRVRLPEQVLGQKQGTCLDLALFTAAALEQAGLNPILVLIQGHAFCGVWLEDRSFPEASTDDLARLRNHLANRDLIVFDPTTCVAGNGTNFDESRAVGQGHLADDAKFREVVDLHRARRGGVRPLPTSGSDTSASDPGGVTVASHALAPDTQDIARAGELRQDDGVEAQQGPERIETWKRRLLDLSLRNRLLSIPKNGKVVRLLTGDIAKLEDELAEGNTYRILQRPDELVRTESAEGQSGRRLTVDELKPLLDESQQKGVLYSDMDEDKLEKRLIALLRDAKTAEEEGGSNNLYLAVGFLKFTETERSEKERYAPVVLVPVTLRRKKASEGIVLEPRAEDPRINVSLLRYLESKHGVRIEGVDPPPDDGSGLDVPRIFQRFREEIVAKRGWEIVEDAMIGMFSFSKILIWRDLAEFTDHLLESPVVKHLVETPSQAYDDGVEFRDVRDLDRIASSEDTYVPMSADSSQLAAILAAAEGKSFVLIGPPGTGKSQTITNLITHCLAMGKQVLFVSEKMAALEVVHRRLTQVGLGDRCLELHSDKVKKKEVLAQLEASLSAVATRAGDDRDGIARKLDQVRSRLNAYVEAIHRIRPSGESIFRVLSGLIGLEAGPKLDLGWRQIDRTSAEELVSARAVLPEARAAAAETGGVAGHPLREIGRSTYTPLWEREAREALESSHSDLGALATVVELLRVEFLDGLDWPAWNDRTPLLRALELWREPRSVAAEALTRATWTQSRAAATEGLDEVEALCVARTHFDGRYERPLEEIDADSLLVDLQRVEDSWFLPRFFGRRKWKRRYEAATSPSSAPDRETAAADLERLQALRKREGNLSERTESCAHVFGNAWKGASSDLTALRAALDWIGSVHTVAEELVGGDPERSSRLLECWARRLPSAGPRDAALTAAMERLPQLWDAAHSSCIAVYSELQVEPAEPWARVEVAYCLEQVGRWLLRWEKIKPWIRWRAARELALGARVEPLVRALEDGELEPSDLAASFERSFGEEWYLHTISADPVLADFQSRAHTRVIEEFRELDKRLLEATKSSVGARIDAHTRSAQSLKTGSQGSTLTREIQKQKRHKPIRTLFKEAGDLIRELRPCMMMSPLSVAQYLDPSLPHFDVVVFDEASQMPVWDAIGAVARGKQLIVVGDPKQLPPTSFFGTSTTGDEDEELETEDVESVLDECIASNIEQHTLSWHYRSRHESLIAFSNRNYYEGKLVTFPSAIDEGMGVSWRHVPDGVYDYGKSATNRGEAEALVAEIVRRLKDPKLQRYTIGVVTLSQKQQALVMDLLDAAIREHPEIEPYFGDRVREPVFVKNLENVQGDERDVILFTICYGPDLSGKVRMNFGPLNNEGGWRRLNVAITRARREVVVFSTLTHDKIDLNRSKSDGVRDLKRFLQFAEMGEEAFRRELAVDVSADFDSPFEEEVCRSLETRGFTVNRQVGCSGYRIDLAVVDPDHPGRFVLGVECDGASYHSAPSARDRDKLRQAVLEDLGWTIHRIWSTDWWDSREREIEELISAVEGAIAKSRASSWIDPGEQRGADVEVAPSPVPAGGVIASGPAVAPGPAPSSAQEQTTLPAADETSSRVAQSPAPHQTPHIPTSTAERVAQVLAALGKGGDAESVGGPLAHYRLAPARHQGNQEDFYADWSSPTLVSAIREVVHREAPIMESLLARRVGEMWGFRRMKAKAISRVVTCTGPATMFATQEGETRVYWSSERQATEYRGARVPDEADESTRREVSEISLSELSELLLFWTDRAGPMSDVELLDHANRSLGNRGLGSRIRERLQAALEFAVERGKLEVRNSVVRRAAH